jgi:hypothetical protein
MLVREVCRGSGAQAVAFARLGTSGSPDTLNVIIARQRQVDVFEVVGNVELVSQYRLHAQVRSMVVVRDKCGRDNDLVMISADTGKVMLLRFQKDCGTFAVSALWETSHHGGAGVVPQACRGTPGCALGYDLLDFPSSPWVVMLVPQDQLLLWHRSHAGAESIFSDPVVWVLRGLDACHGTVKAMVFVDAEILALLIEPDDLITATSRHAERKCTRRVVFLRVSLRGPEVLQAFDGLPTDSFQLAPVLGLQGQGVLVVSMNAVQWCHVTLGVGPSVACNGYVADILG